MQISRQWLEDNHEVDIHLGGGHAQHLDCVGPGSRTSSRLPQGIDLVYGRQHHGRRAGFEFEHDRIHTALPAQLCDVQTRPQLNGLATFIRVDTAAIQPQTLSFLGEQQQLAKFQQQQFNGTGDS